VFYGSKAVTKKSIKLDSKRIFMSGVSCSQPFDGRDLVLVHAEQPIPGGSPVGDYAYRSNHSKAAKAIRVVGYGAVESGGNAGLRRYAEVPILSRSCEDEINGQSAASVFNHCVPRREFVAADLRIGRDTCNGDSGGPAFTALPPAGPNKGLIGITSRGISDECGKGGVYTLISEPVIEWIELSVRNGAGR
jgi:hypothetical protein